jgi:3-aminobutyryl-CoA ammonia-lyase
MSARDAHYGGNLVPGAKMLEIFGDLITDLAIQTDGDEGLFRSYDSVDFLAPVYSGDFIEAKGKIVKMGNTSRRCEFEAWKVIAVRPDVNHSAADILKEPILVAKATGTTVIPKEFKRI